MKRTIAQNIGVVVLVILGLFLITDAVWSVVRWGSPLNKLINRINNYPYPTFQMFFGVLAWGLACLISAYSIIRIAPRSAVQQARRDGRFQLPPSIVWLRAGAFVLLIVTIVAWVTIGRQAETFGNVCFSAGFAASGLLGLWATQQRVDYVLANLPKNSCKACHYPIVPSAQCCPECGTHYS
jgi:hypothetical protein